MESERLWIVLLAAVSFLAGAAGGLLLGMNVEKPGEPAPFEAFEDRFTEAFDLDARQRADLRFILGRYWDKLEELKARGAADHEKELIQIGLTCKQHIREFVLPEERLEEFELMVAGTLPPDPIASR